MESGESVLAPGVCHNAPNSANVFWPSPQQNRIWAENAAQSNSVILLSLPADADEPRLRAAVNQLAQTHEALRTICRLTAGMKVPFQVVLDSLQPAWKTRAQSFEEAFAYESSLPFNREHGPVFRATLVRDQQNSALLLSLPALLGDSDSLAVLARDLNELYGGGQPHPPALSYAQFAQWQSDLLESNDEDAQTARSFWSQRSASGLAWPSTGSFQPQVVRQAHQFGEVDEDVLLAAWRCLLWRLTGEGEFETRVWFSGREHEELRNVIGPIGKYLPLSPSFAGALRFSEVVSSVRAARNRAAEWQEYFKPENPGSVLFEVSNPPQTAPIQIVRQASLTELFSIKLVASRHDFEFHFDASRLSREAVERWASHYRVLLHAALADPETPAARLPLLTEEETRRILVDWNLSAAEYPRERCLHELFEAQVERTPNAPAVLTDAGVLSYAQLNAKANQLAWRLRPLGVDSDSLVGLALDRSAESIIAVLGILKAGGAYVPVSADHPKARLVHQLSGVAAIVTDSKLLSALPDLPCPQILIDGADWQGDNHDNPGLVTTPENRVCVIYTSGSTGLPKGVAVRHRNLVNYAWCIAQRIAGKPLHFATVSPLTADLGNTCVYPSLISGGCLHVIPADVANDCARLSDWQKRHPYDVLKIVPSHLNALLESDAGRGVLPRRHLITGGEPLTWPLVERIRALAPGCALWNHYGPTETTVGSLMVSVDTLTPGAGPIPIGFVLSNTQIYILDTLGQPVPIGVAGELYIAGDGVTAGYLNQPELTAQRFAGGRYRTGDLARYRPDGAVEFLGRTDHQVKIRGYRVEPGEIESVLARYPGVRQAVVIARPDQRGDAQLVAYLAASADLDTAKLRLALQEELPPYMVPAAVVALPKIPLTSNGKIDRQNLPEPEQVKPRAMAAPQTETERHVVRMWCEIFHRDAIGTEENFFDLGGHSLLATQVISRVREHFSVRLDMTVLFRHPTVETLSKAIDAAEKEAADFTIVPVSRENYRARR